MLLPVSMSQMPVQGIALPSSTSPTPPAWTPQPPRYLPVSRGGIRKFVDRVPLPEPAGANYVSSVLNGAGQYIPVARCRDSAHLAVRHADYYEIALVEFTEKLHSDLPPTRLRGYVQLSTTAVPGKQVALNQILTA